MVDIITIPDGDTNWGASMRTNLTSLSTAIDALNGAYKKPVSGIPFADLAAAVQASLAKADTAVQSAQLTKDAVGLSNVDNTSDVNKPVSTATQAALDAKVSMSAAGTGSLFYKSNATTVAGIGYAAGAVANTIAQRTAAGTLRAANPTDATDLATKAYVDANSGGGGGTAPAVRAFAAHVGTGVGNNVIFAVNNSMTTVPLDTVDYDTENGFDASSKEYVVKVAGYYDVNAMVRLTDGQGGNNVGVGVGTQNGDFPTFVWGTPTGLRNTVVYARNAYFNVNDRVRLYVYVDNATPAGFANASMTLTLLTGGVLTQNTNNTDQTARDAAAAAQSSANAIGVRFNSPVTLVAAGDANTLQTTGFYRVDPNSANLPVTGSWFYFEVLQHGSNDWVMQRAVGYAGGVGNQVFQRVMEGGSWAAWQRIDAVGKYAKPSDGIPKADLVNTVQASLTKADNSASASDLAAKYTLPSGGVPKADLASAVQTSLSKADTALQSAPVTSVAARTGAVTLSKSDVGLANVDNTSDANKPVSTATATSIATRAPQNLYGTYATRPAASSVSAGTVYYSSNTLETYRSNGSSWQVVGSGGNELGYAEITSNFTTSNATVNSPQDVTGLVISIVVPERPFMLKLLALTQFVSADRDALLRIVDVGTGTDVLEAHGDQQQNTMAFTELFAERRVSGLTPGITKSYKVIALQRPATYTIFGSSTFPATLQAVTV